MRLAWIIAFSIFFVCLGYSYAEEDGENETDIYSVECQCFEWSTWSVFSTCSKHCGRGKQGRNRTRDCHQALVPTSQGEVSCARNRTQYRSCNTLDCGCDVVCTAWSEWTNGTCSVYCGGGSLPRRRNRKCQGNQGCPETLQNVISCNTEPCSDCSCGHWSTWSNYGLCSVTCGQGVQIRNRQRMCSSLSIGQNCTSASLEISTSPCSYGICCDAVCLPWSAWRNGSCSVTCDTGTLAGTRTRICPLQTCSEHMTAVNACKAETCLSTCGDTCTAWGNRTTIPCTATCGGGTRVHSSVRHCMYSDCVTENVMAETCNVHPCPTCNDTCRPWSSWEDAACSTSCDNGTLTRTRSRSCDIAGCDVEEVAEDSCKLTTCADTCDVDCSSWGLWREDNCSSICDDGTRTRYSNRTCPHGDCRTDIRQDVMCRDKTCAATCDKTCSVWSAWRHGACSASCDDGATNRSRTRTCQFVDCPTLDIVSVRCRDTVCPRTCDLQCSLWSEWHEGNCSTSCDEGIVMRIRFRGCPANLGECRETQEVESPCYLKTCIDTCNSTCTQWGGWRSGTCSQTCDTGSLTRKRFRKCPVDRIDCDHSEQRSSACHARTCPGDIMTGATCGAGDAHSSGTPDLAFGFCEVTCDRLCSPWGQWRGMVCSTTCDEGVAIRTRVRTCQFQNRDCRMSQNSTALCNQSACPDTCNSTCTEWSRWVKAGACSRSCGSGLQSVQRVRSCDQFDCQSLETTQRQCIEGICIEQLKDIRPICASTGTFYPHPTDCGKFFHCVWSIPVELQCPYGTGWVQDTFRCDYKWKLPNCH